MSGRSIVTVAALVVLIGAWAHAAAAQRRAARIRAVRAAPAAPAAEPTISTPKPVLAAPRVQPSIEATIQAIDDELGAMGAGACTWRVATQAPGAQSTDMALELRFRGSFAEAHEALRRLGAIETPIVVDRLDLRHDASAARSTLEITLEIVVPGAASPIESEAARNP